ncbi:hypothetical protein AB0O52_14075 [Arthrobacter sp. NPDC080073]|uniref:hypothetical protein n=1 Tax=Arthrobacter sp. NPDC080073 TaxID=3155919 RepID=UPI0034449CE8
MSSVDIPAWRFVKHHPETKSRDPLQSELLNQESFKPADALVRESIQNSLDAKLPDHEKVRVRIHVSGNTGSLSPFEASPYFRDFWPHVAQCENGGQVAADLEDGRCRFVVIEDFGTCGLTGDTEAARVADGESNNYYYFLRAEGISGKSAGNLGRWGVGKYVFPKSSGVNAFLALTNRSDDPGNSLLVGQSVLMNHTLDGTDYDPDGWWAKPGEGIQMPITDADLIAQTTRRWNITRTDESGLSIVIPYVDESLGGVDFIRSVIRAYFGAILSGGLVVDIDDADAEEIVTLDENNISTLAETYFEGPERDKVVSEIHLLQVRNSIPAEGKFNTTTVSAEAGKKWSSATIGTDTANAIRTRLETGQPVEVTVPLELQLKERPSSPVRTHFHVLLQQDESLRQKPLFLRRGIVISEAYRFKLPGVRAICLVDDEPLTKMLGDAENPAHTTWTYNDKVKARYVRGGDVLDLVKQAPHKIYQLVLDAALEEQRIIFSDIFAAPLDPQKGRKSRGGPERTGTTTKRTLLGGRKRKARGQSLIILNREESGGFSIMPTEYGRSGQLKRVELAVGYTTRRGDALAKWTKDDFELSTLASGISGGKLAKVGGNTLIAEIDDPENFKLTVTGFDTNRDLTIRSRGFSK